MPRHVKPLDECVLRTLTAKRLIAYRNRLLSLEESPELSDCEPTEVASLDSQLIWFKSDTRWRTLYDQVLTVLSTRQNV